MKTPLLSICIPNYNRAELLLNNLRSIGKQNSAELEVVVTDDCSSEDILKTIKTIKKEFPNLKLHFETNAKNLGFDKNVLHVINSATGKFCWLLSNDDQIVPGAINLILSLIKKNKNLSLINVNYSRFDNLLKKTTADRMVDINKDRRFTKADKFFFLPTLSKKSYFKFLGVNTITMSTDIFRRDWWREAAVDNIQFIGHNFIHVFVLADMISKHPDIYFVSRPQVEYLANNHRTWPNDIWKDYNQFLIDHLIRLGYNKKLSLKMRRQHRVYEQKEALVKNKMLSVPYLKTISYLGRLKYAAYRLLHA